MCNNLYHAAIICQDNYAKYIITKYILNCSAELSVEVIFSHDKLKIVSYLNVIWKPTDPSD